MLYIHVYCICKHHNLALLSSLEISSNAGTSGDLGLVMAKVEGMGRCIMMCRLKRQISTNRAKQTNLAINIKLACWVLGSGLHILAGINFGVKSVDRQFHQPKRMHSTVVSQHVFGEQLVLSLLLCFLFLLALVCMIESRPICICMKFPSSTG